MGRNFIVLDTEGVDTVKFNDNRPHPEYGRFYDLGFMVVSASGEVLHRASYANTDFIFNQKLMGSAYYAEKLPQYFAGLSTDWSLADTQTIWREFKAACEKYRVKTVWAYNAGYDLSITNATISAASNGFVSWFTPYGVEWRDIWDYAGSTICNTKKYVKWCIEHDYLTKSGRPSTTAEVVYRYLQRDDSFKEQHTALADCACELAILMAAMRRKEKARRSRGHGWRDAASIMKELSKEDN